MHRIVIISKHKQQQQKEHQATERASKDTNAIDNGVDNTECKTF